MELFQTWDSPISVLYENVAGMIKSLTDVEQLNKKKKENIQNGF